MDLQEETNVCLLGLARAISLYLAAERRFEKTGDEDDKDTVRCWREVLEENTAKIAKYDKELEHVIEKIDEIAPRK